MDFCEDELWAIFCADTHRIFLDSEIFNAKWLKSTLPLIKSGLQHILNCLFVLDEKHNTGCKQNLKTL